MTDITAAVVGIQNVQSESPSYLSHYSQKLPLFLAFLKSLNDSSRL